jgi:glycosyltransferase involved in cell wall biosynthesis
MIEFVRNNKVTKEVQNPIKEVNIYGYANKISGLGVNVRQILRTINNLEISFNYLELNSESENFLFIEPTINNNFSVNLFCSSPDVNSYKYLKHQKLKGKKNIGLWAWEIETLPKTWKDLSNLYDEIWTISEFTKNILEKEIPNIPVKLIKIPGSPFVKLNKNECKQKLGISEDTFVCSFIFDSFSDINRKNPLAVIEAFESSLGDENSILIIKCHNTSDTAKTTLMNYPKTENVKFIFETYSDEEINVLFCATDLYISLHRSEGSGLTIMEAISLGVPCVATNYGGCLDFCLPEFCELVDYELSEINNNVWYKKIFFDEDQKVYWANPNINDAKNKIKKVFNNYKLYEDKTNTLKESIKENYSIENMSDFIKNNL